MASHAKLARNFPDGAMVDINKRLYQREMKEPLGLHSAARARILVRHGRNTLIKDLSHQVTTEVHFSSQILQPIKLQLIQFLQVVWKASQTPWKARPTLIIYFLYLIDQINSFRLHHLTSESVCTKTSTSRNPSCGLTNLHPLATSCHWHAIAVIVPPSLFASQGPGTLGLCIHHY